MRKPAFCISENKAADQLRSNCASDQCLCFCYIDRTASLLLKSKTSSLWLPSVAIIQPGCVRLDGNPKTGFSRDDAHILKMYISAQQKSIERHDMKSAKHG